MSLDVMTTGFSRVFLIENRAGPGNAPAYQGAGRAGAASWDQGDVTRIRVPDPDNYDSFKTKGKFTGEQGVPTLPVVVRYSDDLSTMLRLARRNCDHDIQVHMGECKDPRDFNAGWNKILVLESARETGWGTTDLGALEDSERAVVNEETTWQGEDMYEISRLSFAEQAATQIAREVVGVWVCDRFTCGTCGLPSTGCQVVLGVTKSSDTSPGLVAEVIWTKDGGANWDDVDITSATATEDPNDILCVGTNVVVISQEGVGLHYAALSQVTAIPSGAVTWTKVSTGFVAGGAPRKAFSAAPSYTWIVGAGGYIYFTTDPTASVTVQDAGVATIQQLNDVHGIDILNLVAVGNSNAVVYTTNGGATWQAVTGPLGGSNLNTVWMIDADTWFVGTSTGRLFYTNDGGVTWTEKAFTGSGAGSVRDIRFVNQTVGFMAHSTATPTGRVLRTINGGFSWYVLPEGSGTFPSNQYIGVLATCDDVNTIFGGGLSIGGTDGIMVKGAGG